MRTRRNCVGLWLSDAEHAHLKQQCRVTGLNANTYLRKLIMAENPSPTPTGHLCGASAGAIGNRQQRKPDRLLGERPQEHIRAGAATGDHAFSQSTSADQRGAVMAYDKIIPVTSRLDHCMDYVQNPEKTDLSMALGYIVNEEKTARVLVDGINCDARDRLCGNAGDEAALGQMRRCAGLSPHPFLRTRRGHAGAGPCHWRGVCPPPAGRAIRGGHRNAH